MTDTDVSLSAPTNSAADTEIDLYADVGENELVNEASDDYLTGTTHLAQDADLYNDVITTPSSSTDFTDITNTVHGTNNRAEPNGSSMNNNNSSSSYGGKRFSLYVGQLTWWTTDADLTEAIHELGIQDLLELKFHENRANGQSKGFAVVTVGSDASSRALLDKLPKREIYGQKPMVLHCNKQSLSFFESATRKDEPAPAMNNPPIRPMMHPSMGLPLPMPRPGGPMDGTYRFHHQGHVLLPGGQPGLARPPMGMAVPGRAPVPGGPMVLGQMSGPGGQGPVVVMQPGGPRPGVNGAHLIRQPVRPGAPAPMQMMPGQHPPAGYYPGQPVPQGAPGHLMPGQTHPDAYYRPGDLRHDNATLPPISEVEFNEIMTQNKNVSTSAITRAVEDASRGEFGTAIETLVTAISLIKQSKIAHDDRCKILISSLQDTLKGIEDKSYGSRVRHRSRSGSRESSRKKHRHRSRSPRDRNEYRRSEDYDSKYSREHRRR